MTLSMFVKGEVNFRYVETLVWVCLSKEKLTLIMSKNDFEFVKGKCDFEYVRKSLILNMFKYRNMILNMFAKGKVEFRNVKIWLWICLSKENLTLDMSKYDFEYVCQRKN
jgi:hypothetical protein